MASDPARALLEKAAEFLEDERVIELVYGMYHDISLAAGHSLLVQELRAYLSSPSSDKPGEEKAR